MDLVPYLTFLLMPTVPTNGTIGMAMKRNGLEMKLFLLVALVSSTFASRNILFSMKPEYAMFYISI